MPLMQSSSGDGGNFRVWVKYNGKAGRFYTREDKQDGQEYEVTNFTAAFDMDNIKTGWFLFAAGLAPQKVMDPSLTLAAPKPGDGFKRGFEVLCYSDKNLGGVREFSSTANVTIDAINAVYDEWLAGAAANPGKVPVIQCMNVKPITNKHGTSYSPQLKVVAWADRPEGFDAAPSAAPAPQQSAPPAPAPAQHVPPPPAANPAPVPAGADAPDF